MNRKTEKDEGADPAAELLASLAAHAPFIAPKFFYDPLGSRLFEAICELPEYPLTRAERSIFDRFGEQIAALVGGDRPLLDLGAGNCGKAERLFDVLAPSQYVAVDIAAESSAIAWRRWRCGTRVFRWSDWRRTSPRRWHCRTSCSRAPAPSSTPGRPSETSRRTPHWPSWSGRAKPAVRADA